MQSNSNPDITTHTSRKHIREDVRALIDQTFMQVDEETYKHFLSVLDSPRQNEGFERLINAKKPWIK